MIYSAIASVQSNHNSQNTPQTLSLMGELWSDVYCEYIRQIHTDFALLCFVVVYIHYNDVIMGTIASQITSLTIVYSTVYWDADQRKYQSSASMAFVRGIHRGPVNSPHKWPVTRNMFPFDDVIMINRFYLYIRQRCVTCTMVIIQLPPEEYG